LVVSLLVDEVTWPYYWTVTKQINTVLPNFFSTQCRLLLVLTLREKKFYFEQVLHIASSFWGKAVD